MLADQEHAVYGLAPGAEIVGASQLPAHSLYGTRRAAHRFGDLLGGSALSVQLKEPPHLRFAPRLSDPLHCCLPSVRYDVSPITSYIFFPWYLQATPKARTACSFCFKKSSSRTFLRVKPT
jgi:hypothetical protein